MKKSFLSTIFVLSLALSAFAQDRERRVGLDNFGTASGVKVIAPKPVAKTVLIVPTGQAKLDKKGQSQTSMSANRPKLPMPVKKTAIVRQVSYQSPVNSINLDSYTTPSTPKVSVKTTGNALSGFSTGDSTIDGYILEACALHNIDPLLIYAQMHQESAFKKRAMSHKGARGLMQLMPATAVRFGVTDIYDPKQNIFAGVKYMRWLLNKFDQDVNLALAGYNAGEGAVMKYGNEIPPYNETREYVRRISNRYSLLRDPNAPRIAQPIVTASSSTAASNKKSAQTKKVSVTANASLQKPSKPLNIYERSVSVIKTADGSMQLVSQ